MGELKALLGFLTPVASIYDRKYKTKYKAEVLEHLEAIKYEENKEAVNEWVNHARIDSINSRVRNIMALFSSDFEEQDASST